MQDVEDNQLLVLVEMEGWYLLLPQSNVLSIELSSEAVCTRKGKQLLWWLTWKKHKVSVVTFDKEAQLARVEDFSGNAIVVLGNAEGLLGLSCVNVQMVSSLNIDSVADVPKIMHSENSLFLQLAVHEEKLICVSNLEKIQNFIKVHDE